MLFSSSEVADTINANFEPAWESVRSAPLVTIDFGNGHVVRRTLQGNVATYVCGPDGTVYDLLPGIYTPDVYRAQLLELKKLADALKPLTAKATATAAERLGGEWTVANRLREYHARAAVKLAAPEAVKTVTPEVRVAVPVTPNQFGGGFGGFGGQPSSYTDQLQALARTGGGFKGGGFQVGGFQATGGGFQNFGGGFGGARPMTFSGIEGPVARVIVGAPVFPMPAPPAGRLADRPELKLDTEVNERVRRKAVHVYLAKAGIAQPNDIKKWLFKDVLHADLDDPLLGLGPILNENYPFTDEDRAITGKK